MPCTAFERNIIGDGRELCDAREIAAKRKAVGDLIAAGKCSDATKAALSMGDISFAREVRDFCTPPQDAVR